MPARVVVVDNPVLQGILLELRDERTPRRRFRQLLETAGLLLGYEAARSLPTRRRRVRTPLGAEAEGVEPRDEDVVVVAVLRAALPMAYGVLRVLEDAELGVVAATRLDETRRRDEKGGLVFQVSTPYWKTPRLRGRALLLVDPMLATGSTLSGIAARLAREEPASITVVSLIATRQGIGRLEEALPGTGFDLYTAAVDPMLDERGFIVPGLGDAGDRAFGEA
jgi:uracil phosphoribosyltransferase